ncbi:MAG: hypothetical protein HXX15_09505 [Rhodopseudomonas sp.]|uniref:hypothetical protein n=1 Tax=Rhodopseudomonas sp. TaxID=1078 RepID=UPI001812679E|nr:hypothetical protein [Rhodopseudomonas sp.]NVN86308.1 hypothetical protein [Rhodopseudomonas sp.]
MRVFWAVAMIALLAGPAAAQTEAVQKYGEPDKEKTAGQIEAEKRAERAYQRSLGNVPNAGPTDPWGNLRGDGAPKTAAKPAPAKRTKPANPAN